MSNPAKTDRVKRTVPFCQATGCFEHADVYVVLRETEVDDYCPAGSYSELSAQNNYRQDRKPFENDEPESQPLFDGFKLILYLCSRHDNDLHYLIKGSELQVAKRCYLEQTPGLRRVQPSSK